MPPFFVYTLPIGIHGTVESFLMLEVLQFRTHSLQEMFNLRIFFPIA